MPFPGSRSILAQTSTTIKSHRSKRVAAKTAVSALGSHGSLAVVVRTAQAAVRAATHRLASRKRTVGRSGEIVIRWTELFEKASMERIAYRRRLWELAVDTCRVANVARFACPRRQLLGQ